MTDKLHPCRLCGGNPLEAKSYPNMCLTCTFFWSIDAHMVPTSTNEEVYARWNARNEKNNPFMEE